MENIIFWLVVGLIAGALAKMVVPGEGPGGTIGDIIIGLVGAVIGGWLFEAVIGHSYGGWIGSTFVAFIGAVVLLAIARMLTRRHAH